VGSRSAWTGLCLGAGIFLLTPARALAFVPHDYPGAYPHQIAHLFFAFSTGIFIYYVYRNRLTGDKAWRFIAWSGWLFIVWNLFTFAGHQVEMRIDADAFTDRESFFDGRVELTVLTGFYYLYKLDHLILVPAFLFFYKGLVAHWQKKGAP
jgi:hypothetical protein